MKVLEYYLREIGYEKTEILLGGQTVYKICPTDEELINMHITDNNNIMDLYFGILTIKDHLSNGTELGQLSKRTLDILFNTVLDRIEENILGLDGNYKRYNAVYRHDIQRFQQFYFELLTIREKIFS